MFEINITVNFPDLLNAATILAKAMGGVNITPPEVKAPAAMGSGNVTPAAQFGMAAPIAAPLPAPTVGQTMPANPVPANPTNGLPSMTTSMVPSSPSNAAPVGGAPLAQAPAFTLEQVSKAGAELLSAQPAKMPELMGLLSQFGVQTVNALKPEQLGAFATALRSMGAKI